MSGPDLGFGSEFMAEMLGDFLDESQTYLNDLNQNLLNLEEQTRGLGELDALDVDPEQLNVMFRAAHSLKGVSAMLGLTDINQLTHKTENVLDAARNNELLMTRNVIDVVFQSVDLLTQMIDGLTADNPEPVEYEALLQQIQAVLDNSTPLLAKGGAEGAASEDDEAARQRAAEEYFSGFEDDDVSEKYLAIFIEEAGTSLDELSEILLSNDACDSVDPLLVTCHRIKGSAAAVGLRLGARLAHFMEDLLQETRDAGGSLTPPLAEAILRSADLLRQYVDNLQSGADDELDFTGAYIELLTARTIDGAAPTASAAEEKAPSAPGTPGSGETSETTIDDALRQTAREKSKGLQSAVYGVVAFEPALPLVELKAKIVCKRLSEIGQICHCDPPESELEQHTDLTRFAFTVTTGESPEAVRQRLRLDGIVRIDVEALAPIKGATETPLLDSSSGSSKQGTHELAPQPPAAEPDATKRSTASPIARSKPTETLRVDIDRLDQLMNLAGQLVINKARFGQIGGRLKSLTTLKQATHSLNRVHTLADRISEETQPARPGDMQDVAKHMTQMRGELETIEREVRLLADARVLVGELSDAVHQLERVTDGIQKSVMDTRMVPVGPLFNRFNRVVRDITRVNGKDIRLVIQGEKTELDKQMIDELGDPLIHMVRNSADHGIESPEDRAQAGKPPHGTITLNAYHRGNRVYIEIRDDGRGLDPAKVKRKAIARGLITEADAERMTDRQIHQLIWEPGFSTAEQVTEVSGRGMGMDIVLSKIEELNGVVDLHSEPGVSTTFTIKLPLTMAILPSLLAEVAGDVYAFPVESVVEIVRIRRNDMKTVHGLTTTQVRGRVISVVDLWQMFDWSDSVRPKDRLPGAEVTLVIVGIDGRELGLVVNDLLGEEDIVIKSLAENYRDVNGLAGASILGDGRVSLILDVGSLLQMACTRRANLEAIPATEPEETNRPETVATTQPV